MKLWQKNALPLEAVERFTTGADRTMDLYLARFDVQGSMAHVQMLGATGLLDTEEMELLLQGLQVILQEIENEQFVLEPGVEDVHSQVELLLTRRLGEPGKKIHTGRSRNDQVLVDLKLFFRAELQKTVQHIEPLVRLLLARSTELKAVLMPGYTHFQVGMVSSFGLWLGAYAESLTEDLWSAQSAYRLVNRNPLGSAAGYGSSFPLDRDLTTRLLDFDGLHVNALAAQMSRGKTERAVAQALGNVAATLAKFAYDACLFMSANFGFIRFPDRLTTGSSIMPHKKNPDVFELVRARCNSLQALPNELALLTANLPSGYHRDFQLLKEKLFPAFGQLNECLDMLHLMVSEMQVSEHLLEQDIYKYVFTVEEINKKVVAGVPFREAYRQVGQAVETGSFEPGPMLAHTHIGSLGNLGNERIEAALNTAVAAFTALRQEK